VFLPQTQQLVFPGADRAGLQALGTEGHPAARSQSKRDPTRGLPQPSCFTGSRPSTRGHKDAGWHQTVLLPYDIFYYQSMGELSPTC